MPVIAIVSSLFCGAERVIDEVARRLDYPIRGAEVLEQASREHGVPLEQLSRALGGRPSFWDSLTHGQAKGLILVRAALAEVLQQDGLIYVGPATLLIPRKIGHVLRVCLAAERPHRLRQAADKEGLGPRQAEKRIDAADRELTQWTHRMFGKGPFSPELYDLTVPLGEGDPEEAVKIICGAARSEALKPSRASLQAAMDFRLAAQVNLALLEDGHHYCEVEAAEGAVRITINKEVLRVEPLAAELRRLAARVEGVTEVQTRVGPTYNRPDIIRSSFDFEVPRGALLVDDEQEFVLTLSERLSMRDIESDVVYDGEQALATLEQREPAVMVLDLRMPGIDGMEVLRRVKEKHPRVEVIILTGHGGEEDRREAMELGAFAFLRKPVDIRKLAETMKKASARAQRREAEAAAEEDEEAPAR